MVATSTSNEVPDNYNKTSEVKAFDETKEGAKGLVDAGITQVPQIFHQPPKPGDQYCISSSTSDSEASQLIIPVIDLEGLELDTQVEKEFYTRDPFKPVFYNSNFNLYSASATNWRDTFMYYAAPNPTKPEDSPKVFKYVTCYITDNVYDISVNNLN
ncbi:hypothetical protein ACFX1Z_012807 [Malus domestica]